MFGTLNTLFRARAAEAEEATIAANASRMLAQYLRDARRDLAQGRAALASLISLEKQEARTAAELQEEIKAREEQARSAFEADEECLGGDLTERLLDLEDRKQTAEAAQVTLSERIGRLRGDLRKIETRIQSLTDELRLLRTNATADASIRPAEHRQSALQNAEAMAERLRAQNQSAEDRIAAMADPRMETGSDLDARLSDAGLGARADRRAAMIERLSAAKEA